MSKNCTKVRAAGTARLFLLIRPIRSLFSDVVVALPSSLLKLPKRNFKIRYSEVLLGLREDKITSSDVGTRVAVRLSRRNMLFYYGKVLRLAYSSLCDHKLRKSSLKIENLAIELRYLLLYLNENLNKGFVWSRHNWLRTRKPETLNLCRNN